MKRLFLAVAFSLVSSAAIAQCDPNGIGDAAPGSVSAHMNPFKNRTTEITTANEITVAKILGFAESEDEGQEAQAVELKGHLLNYRHEGAESPNCHSDTRKDYHIWVGTVGADASDSDARAESVVVELTPNIQDQHSDWAGKLHSLMDRDVCVKGWLFFDHDHADQVGKTRGTQWEIHPIMKIGPLGADGACQYWN